MSNFNRKWVRWSPMLLCMAGIFYMSHQPASTLDSMLPWFQKWLPGIDGFNGGHFIAYFSLALTVYWALGSWGTSIKRKIWTVLICTFYGVTDEFHQMFIEGRYPDLVDIRNDTIGATVAMLLCTIPWIHKRWLRLVRKIYY